MIYKKRACIGNTALSTAEGSTNTVHTVSICFYYDCYGQLIYTSNYACGNPIKWRHPDTLCREPSGVATRHSTGYQESMTTAFLMKAFTRTETSSFAYCKQQGVIRLARTSQQLVDNGATLHYTRTSSYNPVSEDGTDSFFLTEFDVSWAYYGSFCGY